MKNCKQNELCFYDKQGDPFALYHFNTGYGFYNPLKNSKDKFVFILVPMGQGGSQNIQPKLPTKEVDSIEYTKLLKKHNLSYRDEYQIMMDIGDIISEPSYKAVDSSLYKTEMVETTSGNLVVLNYTSTHYIIWNATPEGSFSINTGCRIKVIDELHSDLDNKKGFRSDVKTICSKRKWLTESQLNEISLVNRFMLSKIMKIKGFHSI